jgi:ribosomal protein S18 acetylase RimI-like enzyme
MPNTKKFSIFKAKPKDAAAVRALEALVWEEEVTSKYDTPMFIHFGYVFIAKVGKKVVGAIIAFPTNADDVFVSDIVVHPEYQGQGIGEKLYRKLRLEKMQSGLQKNIIKTKRKKKSFILLTQMNRSKH